MNKVCLVGRIASDPEFRKTQSGLSNCSFRIAVQRPFSNNGERQSDFISCVAWRQSADFIHNYLHKGNRIGIEGIIQTRTYDAQDGSKRYVTEVIVDRAEALESRKESAQSNSTAEGSGYTELPDDDELPF